MNPLAEYQRKRDFESTDEPAGELGARRRGAASFVVQKHDASHLHYDFRLELDGVLVSWAVPKGPSLDPSIKRMAVHVEDHPLSYAGFEGSIPAGSYGAGDVIVWDRGTWQPAGDAKAALAAGKLAFELHGQKLRGAWELVRMRGGARQQREHWLLFKKDDAHACAQDVFDVTAERRSVVSGQLLPVDRPQRDNSPAAARKATGQAAPRKSASTASRKTTRTATPKTTPRTTPKDKRKAAAPRKTATSARAAAS